MITVVKIGGNIIDDEAALDQFLENFLHIPAPRILVHGGGKLATQLSGKLGITTKMVDGRRVTDEETLKVITMTYAGWINKLITVKLQALGCTAIGLCGADANITPAKKRNPEPIDFGFVGDPIPDTVNATFLHHLLAVGITPVIAPVTHDGKGQLLNTNADTIAAVIAAGLSVNTETQLIFCFEKDGVLLDRENAGSVTEQLDTSTWKFLSETGRISEGMLPKLNAGFFAKQSGVHRVVIGNSVAAAELANGNTLCTTLVA